jgi:putative DNA primase/helicase
MFSRKEIFAMKSPTATVVFAKPWPSQTLPASQGLPLTDLGNAKRLVIGSGDEIRYCHLWKKWLVWNGKVWSVDSSGEIQRRAKRAVIAILNEAQLCDADKVRELLIKWEQSSESERRLSAMVHLTESEENIPISPDQLDVDPWLMTVANGTLDLRTGHLEPHDPKHLITQYSPVVFDPEAKCPHFENFIMRILDGKQDLVNYIRRWAGYSMTGDTTEQALLLGHGGGNNGKSTLFKVLGGVLGTYCTESNFDAFLVAPGHGIRNDLARLHSARMVRAAESSEGRALDESAIKQLTGGDTIAARFLYSEFFEFTPKFKIWLCTNHKPQIRGTDEAIWRRIRLVPFTVEIPKAERDKNMVAKLMNESSGILNWMLAGLRDWLANGLGDPEPVITATEDYRQSSDVLQRFLDEACVRQNLALCRVTTLFEAYKKWCEDFGEHWVKRDEFSELLGKRGIEKRRPHDHWCWMDIRLRDASSVNARQ